MKEAFGAHPQARHSERGSARVRFIVVLAVVAVVAYMGFQYIPVAYQAHRFKSEIDQKVLDASGRGNDVELLKREIKTSAKNYGVPPETLTMDVGQLEGRLEVTVKYKRQVNILPFWTYDYNFEYKSRGASF
jgi:hypothetical protein